MDDALLRSWCNTQLKRLGFAGLGDVVEYVLALPTQGARAEYWLSLLGESQDTLNFIHEFASRTATGESNPSRLAAAGSSTSIGKHGKRGYQSSEQTVGTPGPAPVRGERKAEGAEVQTDRALQTLINCLFCGLVQALDAKRVCHFCERGLFDPILYDDRAIDQLRMATAQKDRILNLNSGEIQTAKDNRSDFYQRSVDPWLSAEEREVARQLDEARDASRARKPRIQGITFDVLGDEIVVGELIESMPSLADEQGLLSWWNQQSNPMSGAHTSRDSSIQPDQEKVRSVPRT
ncbi:hypothetical protein FVE85_1825 [Porphyridium purpureum]|uniref:Uncharacterized protein n=1 Tax=Porphyridium purpureum TaxID=35688 RepID=A0A5J4YXG7_PORPP|nr:hypothetical protein FVE85_1825 [Porphyridium purpureum]|eukprot:POR8115..scf209_3